MIVPRGSVGGIVINQGKSTFRWLDPDSGDVIFWGNELNLPTIAQEAGRILQRPWKRDGPTKAWVINRGEWQRIGWMRGACRGS